MKYVLALIMPRALPRSPKQYKYYVADDEEPTTDVARAATFPTRNAALREVALVNKSWDLPGPGYHKFFVKEIS